MDSQTTDSQFVSALMEARDIAPQSSTDIENTTQVDSSAELETGVKDALRDLANGAWRGV